MEQTDRQTDRQTDTHTHTHTPPFFSNTAAENEAARLSRLEAGEFNEREVQELEDKIKMEEEQQRCVRVPTMPRLL